MLQILLVRACETEYDEQGRIQGTLDVPLSADGRRESMEIIDQLKKEPIDAVYCSPCEAAKFVGESLAEFLEQKPKTIDKLHNLDQGLWQGMLMEDVKDKQPKVYRQWQEQPETVCPPQGETVTAAKARVAGVVTKLIKKHKGDSLLAVIVPEPLASVFRHVLCRDELGNLWRDASPESPQWERISVLPELVGSK